MVFLGEGQGTADDFDFATLASAAASAGKFHARSEQEILKRRAAFDFEHLAQRQELNLNERFQNLSPDPVKLGWAALRDRGLKNSGADLGDLGIRDKRIRAVHYRSA